MERKLCLGKMHRRTSHALMVDFIMLFNVCVCACGWVGPLYRSHSTVAGICMRRERLRTHLVMFCQSCYR